MKLGSFMTIAAVIALLFGLAFILIPVQLMATYGVTLEIAGQFVARYLGSAFIGIAVITWLARNAAMSDALRAVLLGGLAVSATGLVVAFLQTFSGTTNALVWLNVVIYAFLAAGFGFFLFGKSQD
jgi:hypothetical protein